MTAEDEILFETRGRLAVITLNRPKALNALSFPMCQALASKLRACETDPAIDAVLVQGAGERAFCAGGDVRALRQVLMEEGVEVGAGFFRVEYPMNAHIHHYRKPYIALIDGITIGGGVGISIHGRFRVATERTLFAMPETGIGLFPDVGATYALPRLPGALGMYLGLTGARLGPADCLEAGIATHFVPAENLALLTEALVTSGAADERLVEAVIRDFAGDPGPSALHENRDEIDRCFGQASLDGVIRALEAEQGDWSAKQLGEIRKKSPLSLAVTFRALQAGATLSMDDAMRMEYRLVCRFIAGHDFKEGVRALLVDKDNRPAWQPDRLEAVTEDMVDACFAPLAAGELHLPSGS
jgi:enoyl-CoA hydratase